MNKSDDLLNPDRKSVAVSKKKQQIPKQLCPGLTMGTVLRVQVEGLGSVQSSLVGMEDGQYLIIKTPPLTEIATKLFEKNLIIIHYFYAGQVFGFRSTLLGLIKDPFRFCILSYPASVEILNLRKDNRIYCLIPAELKLPRGFYYGVSVEDISLGGCYFELNTPPDGKFPSMKIGDWAILELNLPESEECIVLNVVVRMLKLDSQTMKVGVQFQRSTDADIDTASFAAIGKYIDKLQKGN